MRDVFLKSLLEAPGDPAGMSSPFDNPSSGAGSDMDQQNQQAADAMGGGDPMGGGGADAGMTDPFGDPNAGGGDPAQGMDLNNNPDGLASPDATGDPNMGGFGGSEDKNLQVQIIQASKLERSLLKSKILDKYRDLFNKIDVLQATIKHNETIIKPEVREKASDVLQKFSSELDLYISYKFSPNNYEENLKNYLMFAKKFSEIVAYTESGTIDKDDKSVVIDKKND